MTESRPLRPGDVRDYEYIINHSPAVIFLWRREAGWPVDFVSENVRLFGYTPEEFTSGSILYAQIIHPDDMARLLAEIHGFLEAGLTDWSQEYRIFNKAGEVRWVEDRTFAPRDPAGVVTHLHGVILDVTEKRQSEEALTRSLREKEVLLKEVIHRVKNNMQVLSSLLNFETGFIKDPAALRVLQDSRDRVRTMALVHEKLYRSPDLSRIDFAEYLGHLASMLVDSYALAKGRIGLDLDVRDAFLSLNAAIPCGLIVNELVSNALKHAFPGERKGIIRIALHPGERGAFRLVVADDGVGMPKGIGFVASESLGLQIVDMLVEQLGGTIAAEPGDGTRIRIDFFDPPGRR